MHPDFTPSSGARCIMNSTPLPHVLDFEFGMPVDFASPPSQVVQCEDMKIAVFSLSPV